MSPSNMTTTARSLSEVQQAVQRLLGDYCHAEEVKAAKLHPAYARLWQAIHAQATAGGKRLRPYILLLTYEAFGGQEYDKVLHVATAWELLHISLLMHDDIIDRDYIRHGQPNVSGKYLKHYDAMSSEVDRLHYAESASLLAGDLILASAYRFIVDSDLSEKQKVLAIDLLHEAMFTVAGGELLDFEVGIVDPTIDLDVIARTKTASYSLVGPLLSGASLAGADAMSLAALERLGGVVGIGYQLMDDLLGVFGNEAQTGKSTETDLIEGKHTIVIAESLKLMTRSDRLLAEQLLGAPSVSNAVKLRTLIEATTVEVVVRKRLDEYAQTAREIIAHLPIDSYYKESLSTVVERLLDRET